MKRNRLSTKLNISRESSNSKIRKRKTKSLTAPIIISLSTSILDVINLKLFLELVYINLKNIRTLYKVTTCILIASQVFVTLHIWENSSSVTEDDLQIIFLLKLSLPPTSNKKCVYSLWGPRSRSFGWFPKGEWVTWSNKIRVFRLPELTRAHLSIRNSYFVPDAFVFWCWKCFCKIKQFLFLYFMSL